MEVLVFPLGYSLHRIGRPESQRVATVVGGSGMAIFSTGGGGHLTERSH